MEDVYKFHISLVKMLINQIWIGDTVSLTKLYRQLDFDNQKLNELRGLV